MAPSVHDALRGIVAGMDERYALWQVSLWAFVPEDQVELLDIWAPAGTVLERGWRLRYTLTPEVEMFAHSVMRGRPLMIDVAERDLGIVRELLDQEGVRSLAVLPVRRGRIAQAVLALGSSKSGVFGPQDLKVLGAVTRGVTARLLKLIEEAADPPDPD